MNYKLECESILETAIIMGSDYCMQKLEPCFEILKKFNNLSTLLEEYRMRHSKKMVARNETLQKQGYRNYLKGLGGGK